MGLFSSIFGSKTSSKASIPSFLKGPLTGYAGDIGNFLNTDPHQYVAPASSLQNLAFSQATNLGSEQAPLNDALSAVKAAGAAPAASAGQAATYTAPTLGAANQAQSASIAPIQNVTNSSLLDNINSYLNPTLSQEVSAAMANYNNQSDQQRAQQIAQMAGNGAWGSGSQFYLSNFDNQRALGGANLEGQLRQRAWQDALNASNMDAQRRQDASATNAGAYNSRATNQAGLQQQTNLFNSGALNDFATKRADLASQAGMFNAGQTNQMGMFNAGLQNDALARSLQAAGMQGDIANSMGANQRADTALTGTLGDMQHSIDQAYASAYPNQLLQAGQMFGPLMGTVGQTQTSSPSPFSAALSVASLFSDPRMKKDAVRIGDWDARGDGLGRYRYRYAWNDNEEEGVMADEVARLRPWALGPEAGGYKTVNYAALGA